MRRESNATRASPSTRVFTTAHLGRECSRRPLARPMFSSRAVAMSDPAPIEPAARPPMSLVPAKPVESTPRGAGEAATEPYRRLAEIFHDVLSEQDLGALLERIADTLADLIPYEDVHIYQADEAKRELIPVLARSKWATEVMSERFSFGEGITGWAVDHREPVLANKAHLDPRVRFVPGTPVDPEALIAVPLIARRRLKGALNIYRVGEDAEFSEEEFLLATRFGDAAALALDNAHIRARLEHQASTDALTGLYNHRTFHDRLREQLMRASAEHDTVALVMLDLDDFKRVNDVYGHGIGDEFLVQVADVLISSVRATDAVCRVGGEEFAIILPSADVRRAVALAERLEERLELLEVEAAGRLSVSAGVAVGPDHAANPRELVACAEAAMMTAKTRGKGFVVAFGEQSSERPRGGRGPEADVRSIAHLKMLQSLSSKLARLNDVAVIGRTIADELRLLIDYHNCRVFVRDADDLLPIAFRGDLTAADPGTAVDVLPTKVGRGITGRVAETGEPLLVGDAAQCEFGERIPGTPVIEESLLAVPLTFGSRVTGVIVISKLGLEQFDADDLRLLEVLAGHAAVALENARLYEAQRREAESARALLEFAHDLGRAEGISDVSERVVRGSAWILSSPTTSLWLQAADRDDLVKLASYPEGASRALAASPSATIPTAILEPWLSRTEPCVLEASGSAGIISPADAGGRIAVAPFAVEGRSGVIAVAIGPGAAFGDRELDLLGGLAQQTKLALFSAVSYETLERTFLSTVEALANALETSDQSTSSHARWIRDFALEVGVELGLEAKELRRLELGALFHDIGKLGIPPAILTKPGPLTAEQRSVVETHPLLGERILAPIAQLREVRRIVRACHERFDGNGYPDRLAGAEIPIESRVIFACDAFHAMTTDRPYRHALSIKEARRRLSEGAGTQFDPRIVAACLRVIGDRE
jgi:diguanylate cyclase (GGDEF)-like protein